MSFLVLTLLIFIAFIGFLFKKYRMSFSCIAVSGILIFMIGTGFIPKILLNNLQIHTLISPEWKNRNIIILLGGGTTKWENSNKITSSMFSYSRVYETAKLYFSCKNRERECFILLSGGDPLYRGISEAEVFKEELSKIGIPNSAFIIDNKSKNTFQNARFSNEILKREKFQQTVLVTSGFHMKRALQYFSYFGIHPIPAPSDYLHPRLKILPLAYNFTICDFAIFEYIGMLRYRIYNFLGLNG